MFEGIITALVTPFRDGGVDDEALGALVERQIRAGIDGVVPCGSTGESATLSHEEHRHVVDVVVEASAGRLKVIAGTGSNSTREAVELTLHAKEAGADGALLLSPYYNKPTQEGIYAHYQTVAREAAFPILVYNIPGRTASNVEPETLGRLAELEFVVGVKEACGNIDQIAHVISRCPEDFCVVSGDDALLLPLLAVGGDGCISTTSNVVPESMLALLQAWREGDPARSLEIHQQLLPLTPIGEANRERLQIALKEGGVLQ